MVRPRRASSIRQTTLVSHGRVQNRGRACLRRSPSRIILPKGRLGWAHGENTAAGSSAQKVKKTQLVLYCSGHSFRFFFDLGPILAHLGSSWPPRRLQDAPKTAQDASKSHQNAPKTPSRASKAPSRAFKTPPRVSKMPPRRLQDAPLELPRRRPELPRVA